ncbi:MarR family transcriptional regulator [Photobacterium sp. GB-72]|uniref:MarR family transcriptional regulator n=1 Tax=Photobacterium sp. GB-72 TaxID=2022105 RepID=UPI000D15EDCA|nr:MarR family transcriptional regulator [Photobacterium sp. GB-72]PSV30328.1 hypothetical protein C9J40_13680 [Photobacterium sp. GB-72]
MAKGIIKKSYDRRIYLLWKSGAFTQTEIAEKLSVHRNTVANAIRRVEKKEEVLKSIGE